MSKTFITAAALLALALTAIGAVHVTTADARAVCLPRAVIQAWS